MSDKYQLKCYIHLYTLLVFVRLIVESMRVLKVGLRQICLTIAASSLFIAHNAAGFISFEGSERVDVDFNKVGRNFVGLVITNYVYVGAGGATFQTTAHCTGVLVASDKILTCAHCLEMPSELKQFRNIRRGSTYFLESMGLTDHVHEDYDERLEGSEHMHRVQGVDLAPELAKDLDNNFFQEAKTGKGFLKDSDL